MNRKQKKMTFRIMCSLILLIVALLLPYDGIGKVSIFILSYVIIGYDILKKAGKGILKGRPFDEKFLMALATIGALCLGEYAEGSAVLIFYQLGELFESYAVGKSRKSISELMDIRPDEAVLEGEDGHLFKVEPKNVAVGSIMVVKPGEKIPIDGIITEGYASLDTSALTGESIPRNVGVGDNVISGCINLSGILKIKTMKKFSESTVSKILDMVENATSRKSKSENFISKFARYYTPVVCFLALALCVLPPTISILFGALPLWEVWIYRALTFLVISCPCALVMSIPLTFFAGIGGAGRAGILIKGSNFMETLSKVKCVVFDKTGTITKGEFEVVEIHHGNYEKDEFLRYAALCESVSNHPISKSIVKKWGGKVDNSLISDVREISGQGICATIDGKKVFTGNEKLMEAIDIRPIYCHNKGTAVHVAVNGEYAGVILLKDAVKAEAKKAINSLKKIGAGKLVMLTGDREVVANAVAAEVCIDKVYASLLPGDKVDIMEKIIKESNGEYKVSFVGDGINDAPVLSRADVGIAMGALGSDAAIEAADVVLMDDNIEKTATALKIAKKCMRIVKQNIYFAVGIKVLCMLLGAVGIANMWLAIFADVGVMVITVLNAVRAMKTKNI